MYTMYIVNIINPAIHHSRNKNAKYPSKWKTFQVPPLTNDALAIIDRYTVRVYRAQLYQ